MNIRLHSLGLPRIGKNRELKRALESYWKGKISQARLEEQGRNIRMENWQLQKQNGLDMVNVGDFSFYDHVLDTSFLLGHLPRRFESAPVSSELDLYFGVARGLTQQHIEPSAMTKWFDTNYHYIVPEIDTGTRFTPRTQGLISRIREAADAGFTPKLQLLGPLSYLYLSKSSNPGSSDSEAARSKLDVLDALTEAYRRILQDAAAAGVEWVQIDEPILVLDSLDDAWRDGFARAYERLNEAFPRESGSNSRDGGRDNEDNNDSGGLSPNDSTGGAGGGLKLLLTTYFESIEEELETVLNLPVAGIHLDYEKNRKLLPRILKGLDARQILSLGVVNGRSPWREDLDARATELKEELIPLLDGNRQSRTSRLWLAPTCSLLHLPWSIQGEQLPRELEGVLGFTVEKLADLNRLGSLLKGRRPEKGEQKPVSQAPAAGGEPEPLRTSGTDEILDPNVEELLKTPRTSFARRSELQQEALNLPSLPTTTIGSFPQTPDIRKLRLSWKRGEIDTDAYEKRIKEIIEQNIRLQEEIGLDVLVHGEPERSDMVSFFADRLEGVWSSKAGWVQSYGSRCVKPPVIHASVRRSPDLGWKWISYAQGLTDKPVKGMLTGPVTIMKWSFVPPHTPPEKIAYNIALALREEVLELESNGISIIQIDEPAFREVLPLKQLKWPRALEWGAEAFRLSHAGVKDGTQIHSHMCYSDFNSIFEGIDAMDADVISIETSRSQGELFGELAKKGYTKGLGPGVYDIHSPLVPEAREIRTRVDRALAHLDPRQLWVNPDCGLKTRSWDEAKPALKAMVDSARELRNNAVQEGV
ncbi:5-methyltetrahydropteroyltriglutamate--homocysteine S-methyltransferase [Salinispira pacifica]|uniref:5-methyltetrahydropteroyltriglutamate--homocysteine S-methyltransferase n=1 Tax=Salinispira pacifica TaxID=1307761 RepID=V5WLN9_9SPIO|nr:5-methyltetrahydropteroyltriglutamate--homocysteine S-methyltransferase [Salinispira pacifica]AHC16523.1 5-methyltetrahydropteroyltriglutamate-- homocysteine methyltransferase [Salinispira pacifica]